MGRQDARALARAYAMKAVEDKNASDVIVGKFSIFELVNFLSLRLMYMH